MKKIYSIILCLSVVGSLSAQKIKGIGQHYTKHDKFAMKVKPSNQSEPKGLLVWENSVGNPDDWNIVNNGVNAEAWSLVTDPSVIPVDDLSPMASTTANDGFLFVNSDGNNMDDGEGTPINTTVTLDTSLAIDLTNHPYVNLSFQHNYRWWKDTRGVRVSNDLGATWYQYQITAGLNETGNCIGCGPTDNYPGEQSAGNPVYERINISDVAGGQDSVLIQFYYSDDDIWAWYWAVDDVKINEVDDYDAQLDEVFIGSTGAWGETISYSQIPTTQVPPISFSGAVKNLGLMDINATFVASLPTVYEGISDTSFLTPGTLDTLDCTTALTPPATVAIHTISFNVTTDSTEIEEDSLNNLAGDYVVDVNEFIYARDADTRDGGYFNQGQNYDCGNIFDIYNDVTLYGVDFVASPSSVAWGDDITVDGLTYPAETKVVGKLWRYDTTANEGAGDFILLSQTFTSETDDGNYHLNAEDLDNVKTLYFQDQPMLMAGEAYLVTVGSFGNGADLTETGENPQGNDFVIATSGTSPAQTSYYRDGMATAAEAWGYITGTPMVRMNFNPSVGINETASNTFKVYPNPTSDIVNIKFTDATNATISVMSLSGREVMTSVVNGTQASFSTEGLSNGVYVIKVSNGTNIQMTKVVIRK